MVAARANSKELQRTQQGGSPGSLKWRMLGNFKNKKTNLKRKEGEAREISIDLDLTHCSVLFFTLTRKNAMWTEKALWKLSHGVWALSLTPGIRFRDAAQLQSTCLVCVALGLVPDGTEMKELIFIGAAGWWAPAAFSAALVFLHHVFTGQIKSVKQMSLLGRTSPKAIIYQFFPSTGRQRGWIDKYKGAKEFPCMQLS